AQIGGTMPLILTEKTLFQCTHGMTFKLAAKRPAVLTVDGVPCLTKGDLDGAVITGTCGIAPSSTVKPCASIVSAVAGGSLVLAAGDSLAIDESVSGMTDGSIGGAPVTYTVSRAAQAVLLQS